MNQPITRRRMLGWMGAGTALTVLPPGALRAEDTEVILRNLRWEGTVADAIWEASNGPNWVVHDNMAMYWGGGRALHARRPKMATPLTGAERADIIASLAASSAYFRARGLWAPRLPTGDDNAFHIFYVDAPDGINGGTGQGAGDPIDEFFGIGDDLRNIEVAVETLSHSKEYLEKNPDRTDRLVPEGIHMMMSGPLLRTYRKPPDDDHRWVPQIALAHELIHAIDHNARGFSGWGAVNGWCGEGSTHAIAQFALRRIGYDPLKSYATGVRNIVKDIGLRPYDVTLALTEVPRRIPEFLAAEVRENGGKESERATFFWKSNATYLTCSFWRFLFQEEAPVRVSGPARQGGPAPTAPGDFELFAPFRDFAMTGEDRARAAANSRWTDPVLVMLDRFLRTRHPVWGKLGLYRAFPAFIAHFVEWPDQVAESRKGFLAHDKWLDGMFVDGVPLLEIAPGQDIIHEPAPIPPYAARALRFKLPRIEGMPETLLGTEYPRITITVTALNGPRNAIDHIHIGVRGGVLGNVYSQAVRSGAGRVRRWMNIDARPLFESRTKGESVLTIINAAPSPETARPLKVRVHIAVQVAGAFGQCSYHPLPVPNQNGQMVTIPSSASPPAGQNVPMLAVERGIDGIDITIVQDADLVELVALTTLNATGSGMEVQRKSERGQGGMSALDPARIQALAARAGNLSTKKGLTITLTLPRVEPGMLGSVSGARVTAEWVDPAYDAFADLGMSKTVSLMTDAVEAVLTTNSEGTLIGTYAANFDAASDNPDRIYRGRISGKFSTGVVKDEAREAELPEEKFATVPTDFFIALARAGFDVATMAAMSEAAAAESADGGWQGGTADSDPASPAGSADISRNDIPCAFADEAEFRNYLDQYLRALGQSNPAFTPEVLRDMRSSLISEPEAARNVLCSLGYFPGGTPMLL